MRGATRTLLIAVIATAAITVSTPASYGGVTHCPAVTGGGSGGCVLHVSGANIELRKHVFGIESHITECDWELDVRLDEEATGYIADQLLANPSGGGTCTRQPCMVGGSPTPWTSNGSEAGAAEVVTTNFCLEPLGGGADETCEIDVPFAATGTDRHQLGQASEFPSHGMTGFRCELIGTLDSEAGGGGDHVDVAHGAEAELELTLADPAPLEITDEVDGEHCESVVVQSHGAQGGCLIHITNTEPVELRKHVFGIETHVTTCETNEFQVRLDEDGSGYAVNQALADGGCSKQPCDEVAGKDPWPVATGENGGSETVQIGFCLEALSDGIQEVCGLAIPLDETSDHKYELGTVIAGVTQEIPGAGGPGFNCEAVGHWATEAVPHVAGGEVDVEVSHYS